MSTRSPSTSGALDQADAEALRRLPAPLRRHWPPQALPLDAAALVTLLYLALLGREPDAGGLTAHVRELEQCLETAELVSAFIDADEFRQLPASGRLLPPVG